MIPPGPRLAQVIQPWVEQMEPLTGPAATQNGAEIVFHGWREVIGTIAKVLGGSDGRRSAVANG